MHKYKNILITGFGPFAHFEINPSQLLVEQIAKALPVIDHIILPVSYDRCFDPVAKQLNQKEYDLIVSFGVASTKAHFSVEQMAYNLMDSKSADTEQVTHVQRPIFEKSASSLECSGPVMYIYENLQKAGLDVELSVNPGRYVCNALMYHSLKKLMVDYNFIHIPEFMAVETYTDTIVAMLEELQCK